MLLVAFPTFSGDVKQLHALLKWIKDLGGCANHKAVIVADYGTPFQDVQEALKLARESFSEVFIASTTISVTGWIAGANAAFWRALEFAKEVNLPVLFHEPDAVPLKPGWLDIIELEYLSRGEKYMGAIYRDQNPHIALIPKVFMSGVAVYFPGAFKELPHVTASPRAFDVDLADWFVKDAADTKLIKHIWGVHDDPPRFGEKAIAGTSMFQLSQIPEEAVLFHRNKDGSLIRQLRKNMGIVEPLKGGGFVDVLNFCQRDAALALENIKWQRELGGCGKWDCLMAHESNVDFHLVKQIEAETRATYGNVFTLAYPPARIPGWPSGPNWGFQHVANYMQNLGRPWLFHEPDFWPLCRTWLDQLQEEYAYCGKACMGNVVKDFGHLQGTSIYPADLPVRFPKMMQATSVAFDTVSKDEVLKDCHAANNLFCHIWGLNGVEPHHFVGTPISFSTADQARKWIPDGAVAIHRCKDKSIADRLREVGVA